MKKSTSNLQGVGFILLAILIFSLQGVAVKWIGGDYSIMQIVLVRTLFSIPITVLLYRLEGKRGLPTTQHHQLQYIRGFFLFMSYVTIFMAIAALPLAEVDAIRFSAPLMITLLSVVMLGEKVSLHRWGALVAGFAGILFIVRPGTASFNLGSVFVLVSVLFYALNVMLTRKLQATDSSATMAYFSSHAYLAASLVLSPLAVLAGEMPESHPSIAFLFRAWSMPTLLDLVVMAALALIWAGGMYFMARAYSAAPASVIAPFEYTSLPINVMWGFLFWNEVPTWMTWVGASLALLSGLYILNRERINKPDEGITPVEIPAGESM